MKKVFVLGAGKVSAPLVHYLLGKGFAVTITDLNLEAAQNVIGGHEHGKAVSVSLDDSETLGALIAESDLVISLLPPFLHPKIAKVCLEKERNFLTASYLSDEMKAIADEVKEKGLIFMNEIGVDPGLDHLTAMEMIDQLKEEGYTILGFDSHCGGIPSRQSATTPLRYKFSWSPAGVMGALTRASQFRRNGNVLKIPGSDMLKNAEILHIPGAGIFESTPNADSLYYGDRYGIADAPTIRRGTLRYPGWAEFWKFMLSFNFLDKDNNLDFEDEQVLSALFQTQGKTAPANMFDFVAEHAPSNASLFLEALEFMGFLDPEVKVTGNYSAFKIILERAEATLLFNEGESDLLLLHHEFIAEKDGKKEKWTSTLVREGDEETTAMAFLVGVPAAIAARLILEDKISQRGVLIPLEKECYEPILHELAELGMPHQIIKTPIAD